MTALSKTTIKTYFNTGDKPTEDQFASLIDSYADYAGWFADANNQVLNGSIGVAVINSLSSASVSPAGSVGLGLLSAASQASAQAVIGLTATSANSGFVAVSDNDTTTGRLFAKCTAGSGIALSVVSAAGVEQMLIGSNFATTAQAVAGAITSRAMNPVLVKNAVAAFSSLVPIQTQTVTSSVASVTFSTGLIYSDYVLFLNGVKIPSGSLTFNFSIDSGATFKTDKNFYHWAEPSSSSTSYSSSVGVSANAIYFADTGSVSTDLINGIMQINGVGVSGFPSINYRGQSTGGTSIVYSQSVAGAYLGPIVPNAFKIQINGGPQITGGEFALFGVP